jgi:tRNA pseudouridine65 synthase
MNSVPQPPSVLVEPLYRDDRLVVVNKPAGMLVHRGWANDRVTLLSLVRNQLGQHVYPAHRLDRATSGILLFALDPAVAALLQAMFSAGAVIKNYLALTRGVTPQLGLVDHALAKSKDHDKQPAQTALRRLATFERYSLIEARTFTGRQHQIRRHLKHLAHPLIGDTRYGKGVHNRRFRSEFSLQRLALHASKLKFEHPLSGETLELRAPLPADLVLTFDQLGVLQAAESAVLGPSWQPEPGELPLLAPTVRAP